MNVLLAMSIMFKFANEVSDRNLKFRTLSHIGFLDSAKSRIILKEVFYLYLFIVVSILIYLVNIFATLYIGGLLTMKTMSTLLIVRFYIEGKKCASLFGKDFSGEYKYLGTHRQ